jgi:transcription initiation factor TFIIIB Brf1 subunit/transcription initiation factor TFIIB
MVQCNHCHEEVEVEMHDAGGFGCCPSCGCVLEDLQFASDVQFQKGADGEGEMVGQFVNETGQVRGAGRMAGGRMMGPKVRGGSCAECILHQDALD